MKKVERYETRDGRTFPNHESALSHAEKRYGEAITGLAHELVRIEKYKDMIEFLEANLDRFAWARELREDRELENEDDGG